VPSPFVSAFPELSHQSRWSGQRSLHLRMVSLSPLDEADLRNAVAKLESESFAMTVASKFGVPVEALLRMLPSGAHDLIGVATNKALTQCLRIAINAGRSNSALVRHKHSHTFAVAVTGAVGGFFGLPGLLVELPITTTVMLHSIVEIARGQGEDLSDAESALACLSVFALGPQRGRGDALESAYYATRAALAQVIREAATYVTEKGLVKESAPVMLSLVGKIGARFGVEISEKAAAELVPIAGSAGGMTVNVLFARCFQSLAEGHFTVRRLERKYGAAIVREEYDRIRSLHSW
jgi:hypothetical protein